MPPKIAKQKLTGKHEKGKEDKRYRQDASRRKTPDGSSSNKQKGTKKFQRTYFYRVLRPEEEPQDLLTPKDITSVIPLDEHVTNGNRFLQRTKYISCCKTLRGLERFYEAANEFPKNCVRFTVNRGIPYWDLTNRAIRAGLIHNENGKRSAKYYREIVFEGNIEPETIERIEL